MIGLGNFRPCPVHLGGAPTGLACTCPAGHPYGHVYAATAGAMDAEGEQS